METFGELFNKERLAKRKTLREISKYVGKSIGYLSDIEHNRKGPPDLETVRKIEECLGIINNSLVTLAARLRTKVSPDITQRLQMNPRLSELLLRADDLSEEEQNLLIETLRKRSIEEGRK